MDPDENLREQLELANSVVNLDPDEDYIDVNDYRRLSELVLAFDGWILGGGFLPERWRNDRRG